VVETVVIVPIKARLPAVLVVPVAAAGVLRAEGITREEAATSHLSLRRKETAAGQAVLLERRSLVVVAAVLVR